GVCAVCRADRRVGCVGGLAGVESSRLTLSGTNCPPLLSLPLSLSISFSSIPCLLLSSSPSLSLSSRARSLQCHVSSFPSLSLSLSLCSVTVLPKRASSRSLKVKGHFNSLF